ncbi:nucleoside 2-deoxyribosyltransferase domain-containing protein [Fibrella forsythiae]|uniref:Nucleoside 2-deoxyribosyltransferase domain-containing protein n=1 Tax=Fibrella forsythiae TaxID=2817061 RepID=A0ABS3JM80_9BACT|nr:nucleoside 2-deoxyribosyltransferase domain-containing protein [Fibrella forsythiae]MBO0951109.1 nucleoside 2-deoxyribosyltransferase domain-containing protein [Fibrella forsythiae]
MRYSCFTIALLFLSLTTSAQKVTIIKSPAAVPAKDNRPKIFLGGSIDMGTAENWQAKIEQQLTDKNAVLLNPRRDDWNKDWKPVISDSNFRKQVEWELSALEQADIIMYFSPTSQSPISLLELGLYAKTKKLMVVCPDGYWRKGMWILFVNAII